jgi:hypothetical protein
MLPSNAPGKITRLVDILLDFNQLFFYTEFNQLPLEFSGDMSVSRIKTLAESKLPVFM